MNTSGPMCSWQVAPAVSLKPMVAVSRSVYGAHTWSVSMYAAGLYGSTAPGSDTGIQIAITASLGGKTVVIVGANFAGLSALRQLSGTKKP